MTDNLIPEPNWSLIVDQQALRVAVDLNLARQTKATREAVRYIERCMPDATITQGRLELIDLSLQQLQLTAGLVIEFGVAGGHTINHIANQISGVVHGFDSFEGIPEPWNEWPTGSLTCHGVSPSVGPNVELHVGLFSDTLPNFVAAHPEHISFCHVDCDLYSSTKCILEHCAAKFLPGTIIVFDEYFNHADWKKHEHKAFQEYVKTCGVKYRYIGYNARGRSVALAIESIGA